MSFSYGQNTQGMPCQRQFSLTLILTTDWSCQSEVSPMIPFQMLRGYAKPWLLLVCCIILQDFVVFSLTCVPCLDGRKIMWNVNRSLWDVMCESIPSKTHMPEVIIPQLILLQTTLDLSGQLMAKEVQLHSLRMSAGKSCMWCECHNNKSN